jgi:hypothetical protein
VQRGEQPRAAGAEDEDVGFDPTHQNSRQDAKNAKKTTKNNENKNPSWVVAGKRFSNPGSPYGLSRTTD